MGHYFILITYALINWKIILLKIILYDIKRKTSGDIKPQTVR